MLDEVSLLVWELLAEVFVELLVEWLVEVFIELLVELVIGAVVEWLVSSAKTTWLDKPRTAKAKSVSLLCDFMLFAFLEKWKFSNYRKKLFILPLYTKKVRKLPKYQTLFIEKRRMYFHFADF